MRASTDKATASLTNMQNEHYNALSIVVPSARVTVIAGAGWDVSPVRETVAEEMNQWDAPLLTMASTRARAATSGSAAER